MIKSFIAIILAFAAVIWLPLLDPVKIEFMNYNMMVSLWILIFFQILLLFTLLLIAKLIQVIRIMPRHFKFFSRKVSERQLVKSREKMLMRMMVNQYDGLVQFANRLDNQATWSDRLFMAIAALRQKLPLKFDESLIALRKFGFTEHFIEILRLFLLSKFSNHDVEMEMLEKTLMSDAASIVWQWALDARELHDVKWFDIRHEAQSHLQPEDYDALISKLIALALKVRNAEDVYQSLTRSERKRSDDVCCVLEQMYKSNKTMFADTLKATLKQAPSERLYDLVSLAADNQAFVTWFLKFSVRETAVYSLRARAILLLILPDNEQLNQTMIAYYKAINLNDNFDTADLSRCHRVDLAVVLWWCQHRGLSEKSKLVTRQLCCT